MEVIAQGIGRQIQFQPITIQEFGDGMKAAGLPDSYVWLFSYLFEEVLGNAENQTISHDIEKVLGRPATDFEDYVKKTEATGVWNQAVAQSI